MKRNDTGYAGLPPTPPGGGEDVLARLDAATHEHSPKVIGDAAAEIRRLRATVARLEGERVRPRHSTHLMAENGGPLCRIRGYMEKPVTMKRNEVTCGRCKRSMGSALLAAITEGE